MVERAGVGEWDTGQIGVHGEAGHDESVAADEAAWQAYVDLADASGKGTSSGRPCSWWPW